jgi:hypothetical protein
MTRVLRIVALPLCVSAISSPPALGLSVSGNHLVDDSGGPIRLLGVSRSGSEYACAEGNCHTGPSLIQDYRGRPTGFGIGFRNHLLKIRRHARG